MDVSEEDFFIMLALYQKLSGSVALVLVVLRLIAVDYLKAIGVRVGLKFEVRSNVCYSLYFELLGLGWFDIRL